MIIRISGSAEGGGLETDLSNEWAVKADYCEPSPLAYSMSKDALMMMTFKPGTHLHHQFEVRVNQMNPSWVLTENGFKLKMNTDLSEDCPSRLPHDLAPSGGSIPPETIASAVIGWLSDHFFPISGSNVDLEQVSGDRTRSSERFELSAG